MKVLMVHPSSKFYGGAELVITKLANYLTGHGHKCTFIFNYLPDEVKKQMPDARLIEIGGRNRLSQLFNLWDETQMYARDFDIINVHNFPATVATFPSNKPTVYQLNEPAELFTSPARKPLEAFNRWWLRKGIKNIVVADKFNAERCESLYHIKPYIIPYGIDYEFFSKVQHKPDEKYFTVMQVGTVTPYKNQLSTINAVADVKGKIKNIRLWLIGKIENAGYQRQVEDAIRDRGLGGYVVQEDHVDRKHLQYLYSMADVLVHPVREQGGWLSPFEAVSAGCPIIVSPELTCSDMVARNELGIVTKDYSRAIYQIYQEYERFEKLTEDAKVWVSEHLTWDKYCERMVNKFQEIINAQ